ncbi:MAG: MerR family transcriptional regulator [Flammeovirgaceae bacterium]|nr:MerR family transcriptional regulator [Flammeovirgaceae bacterium]
MGQYSIKELEKLSGIKAHTIRIWEKRHQIIEPNRTSTNIRYYSDADLKKIINVSLLNNHGVKISRIAEMDAVELNSKIQELTSQSTEHQVQIDALVLAMISLEEEKFEKTLSGMILRFGFEQTVVEILYPFLEKIGILWQTNQITPAQEHFISNLVRQKMMVAIDGLELPPKDSPKAVLFLPENELHEIGLLFYYYLAKKNGIRTYYLGQMVPHSNLKQVYDVHQPDFLILSLISPLSQDSIDRYTNSLANDFPNSMILISGSVINRAEKNKHKNIHYFRNALEIKEMLKIG